MPSEIDKLRDQGSVEPAFLPTAPTGAEHETKLESAGSYYSWECTCGKASRYLRPLYMADRNAKAHVRKARREAAQSNPNNPKDHHDRR